MTYALIFLASLTFSGHCLGMCGVFPAALRAVGGAAAVRLQIFYQAGKTSTYVALGLIAAAAGMRFERFQRPLGIAAGIALILVGTSSLLPRGAAPRLARWVQGSPLCTILSDLLRDGRPLAAFSVGVFNGLVPCGLVYAMLAYAASMGSIPGAALAMLCFGAGTVPALGLAGMSAHLLRSRAEGMLAPARLVRISGWLTLALGAAALVRAASASHAHLQHLLPRA